MPVLEQIPRCRIPQSSETKRRTFTFLDPADLSEEEIIDTLISIKGFREAHLLVKSLLIDFHNHPTASVELIEKAGARTPLSHWMAAVNMKWRKRGIGLHIVKESNVDFHQARYQIFRVRRH